MAPAALAAAAALLTFALWPGADPEPDTLVLGTGEVALDDGVLAEVSGRGTAAAAPTGTTVSWVEGSITLDVDPNRVGKADREVRIETEEAVVRVLGTVLTVDRGPFGTEVSVERGVVETTCQGQPGTPEEVRAGERTLCLRSAGTGIGYLLLLERQGAAPEQRLAVIERALSHEGGLAESHRRLNEERIDVLLELGRHQEAIGVTSTLPKQERIGRLSLGAQDAMMAGRCGEAAEPWLVALSEAGEVTGTLLLVQCLAESDPARAKALLKAINRATLTPAQAASVEQWEDALR